jgi:hypothetical protein
MKSKRILEKGKSVWVGTYNRLNGSKYVAEYKGKYYYIIDDGTGNGFFTQGEATEILFEEAQKLCAVAEEIWQEASKTFGWSAEIPDEVLGL